MGHVSYLSHVLVPFVADEMHWFIQGTCTLLARLKCLDELFLNLPMLIKRMLH